MLILLIEVLPALAAARLVVQQAEVAYVASKGSDLHQGENERRQTYAHLFQVFFELCSCC